MTSIRNNRQDLPSPLERARTHGWTPEERRAQVISFAYGNIKLHNPAITREDVERIYEQLFEDGKYLLSILRRTLDMVDNQHAQW